MIRDDASLRGDLPSQRRELRDFTSELSAIPGVGDKRKTSRRHFGSIHRIAAAAVSELTPFVGKKTAQEIADHFARQRALAESGTQAVESAEQSAPAAQA